MPTSTDFPEEQQLLGTGWYIAKDPEVVYSMEASRIERVEVLQQTSTQFGGFSSYGGTIVLYSHPIQGEVIANE